MDRNTRFQVDQQSVAAERTNTKSVLDLLQAEASFGNHVTSTSKNALFARLYFFTTQRWLEHANSSVDPKLIYMVADHFYDLYSKYVLEDDQQNDEKTVSHWNVYKRLVDGKRYERSSMFQTVALFMGVRAHTRYDLAEAICLVHDRYQQRHGSAPDLEHFRSLLFGRQSDRVFREASIDFVESLAISSKNRVFRDVLKAISLVWLPVFQAARMMAWNEARRSISSSTPISRQGAGSISGSVS